MPAGEPSRSSVAVSDTAGPDFAGLLGSLTVALGNLTGQMAAAGQPPVPWTACHPVPLLGAVQLTSGAGSFGQPNSTGPNDPYWWDLRSLAVWGFTAGTVTFQLNSTLAGAQEIGSTTVPGEFTWSAQHLLAPRDYIIISATGVTGTVSFGGQAIEVETAWLPAYLM